jgi:hypothetical protein
LGIIGLYAQNERVNLKNGKSKNQP